MVKLAVQAALTNEERIIKKEELAKELNVKEEELEGTDVWTYISKNKNYYYITPLGEITKSKGIAYSKIKVGTNVTGYKGLTRDGNTGIDNWKVYYVDDINNNVYLISSEVTETDTIPMEPKITNQSLVWQNQAAQGYSLGTTGTLSSSSVSRSSTEYFLVEPLDNGNALYGQNLWTYGTKIGYQWGNSKGIRPIVCIKSGTSIYDDGNGGYTFELK